MLKILEKFWLIYTWNFEEIVWEFSMSYGKYQIKFKRIWNTACGNFFKFPGLGFYSLYFCDPNYAYTPSTIYGSPGLSYPVQNEC